MTLQTSEKSDKACLAFTLLELLLVITMMALLTSFALPRFNSLARKTRIEQGTERLAAIARHGRIEAVKRGLKVQLEFKDTGTHYRLTLQDVESKYRESFIDFRDPLLDTWQSFPEHVYADHVVGPTGKAPPTTVTFFPRGNSSVSRIVMKDAEGNERSIYFDALPTDVRVEHIVEETNPPEDHE